MLDTVKGFVNRYKPKNLFSFEFAKRNKQTGNLQRYNSEYFLTVGPTTASESFKFRISFEPTFNSGTSVVDMGKGNSTIKLDGEFYIYFFDTVKSKPKSGEVDGSGLVEFGTNLAKDKFNSYKDRLLDKYSKLGGINVRSGIEEFFDLMGLLYYSRFDKTIYNPSTGSQGQFLKDIITYSGSNKFSYSNSALIFHDYDRGRHVEVIIPSDGFTVSRSTKDTNTYQFSLNMVVINDLEKSIKPLAPPNLPNPFNILSSAITDLQNIINFPLQITGLLLNVATFVSTLTASGQVIVNTFNNMRDRFNSDGKRISATFQSAVNDVNRALGRKPKATLTEQIEGLLDTREELLAEITTSEELFSSQTANAIAQAQYIAYLIQTILTPPNNTGNLADETLLPNYDSTNLIQNEVWQWTITFQDTLQTIQSAYIQASIDDSYSIYYAPDSATFRTIAKDVLGDESLASALAQYNKKSLSQILAGQAVKIPFGTKTNMFGQLPENPTTNDLESGLLGYDLALTSDRDFLIAPNRDLAVTDRIDTLVENLVDIVDIPVGSWIVNELIGNYMLIGETLDEIEKQGSLQKLLQEIQSDPRVKEAEILSVEQDGDILRYVLRVKPIAGREFSLRIV